MSTDWRETEAGRELDLLIARRLGWRYDLIVPTFAYMPDGSPLPAHHALVKPNGQQVFGFKAVFDFESEENAWAQFWYYECPHYSTSVDAALTLPFDGLKGGWDGGNSLVVILDTAVQVRYMMTAAMQYPHPPVIAYGGDTDFEKPYPERLAVAICRAWLQWRDSST